MKNTSSKKRMVLLWASVVLMLTLVFSDCVVAKSYVFKWSNIKEVEITAQKLNIRTGPGTSYQVIGYLSQGNIVSVVGSLGGWYVIHTNNDMIGVISSTYTRVISYYNTDSGGGTTSDGGTSGGGGTTNDNYSYAVTAEEQKMVDLINSERAKNGLTPLTVNADVMRVARIKAEDLSKNQYFAHNSPTYGSPFDMMKSFGISYQAAGENIAGNQSVEAAHTALMNSPGHRANILSSSYAEVGIGIYNDSRYGKVFVQMFIRQ